MASKPYDPTKLNALFAQLNSIKSSISQEVALRNAFYASNRAAAADTRLSKSRSSLRKLQAIAAKRRDQKTFPPLDLITIDPSTLPVDRVESIRDQLERLLFSESSPYFSRKVLFP